MREIVVDSFAGGGGASLGIEMAIGRPVDIAINHDKAAILMHKTNHPNTKHYCENIWDVDPVEATGGRPVGLMWASPDCRHFSKAKGGKPVEKKIRGLAWVVLKWAAKVRPRVIILENVEEFVTWGPVRKGRPVKSKKGVTFEKFVSQLRALGYKVDWRELRACDYGTPTTRKRFFLIARCDGQPIRWPKPTHGDPESLEVQCGLLKPWRTAAECIDWSLPCPSIFERKKPLAENTLRRIARGIQKFILHTVTTSPGLFAEVRAFLMTYYGNGDDIGQRLDEPLRTITSKDRFGIITVAGQDYQIIDIGMRMLTPRELFRAQGFPDDYIIDRDYTGKPYPKKEQVARCGNAVPPQFAEVLVKANLPELCRQEKVS